MKVKQIKRRCMVNGCRNTASFHITRRNQLGNSIHICEDCLREALCCIDDVKIDEVAEEISEQSVAEMIADNTNTSEEVDEKEKVFICGFCGKEYKTEAGLAAHKEKAHFKI